MPDKVVQLPDGKVVSFPDSMADADIAAVIKKQMAPAATPAAHPLSENASRTGFFAAKGGMATPPPEPTNAELGKEAPYVAGGLASALTGGAGLPLLARAGIGAAAAGGASALSGNHPQQIAEDAALAGAGPEVGGSVLGKVGEGLSSMASKSLARILRLTPKAFQFGREPAKEVLERGLTSGNLKTMADSIGEASKQTTSELNGVLEGAKGTADAQDLALQVVKDIPGTAGNRFLQVVDDAASKLKFTDLKNLSASDLNALKQEVAKQGKFVEGETRASVNNAIKQFGGKSKDAILKLAPDAADLLETSANLTEASKGADLALRTDKAGRSSGGLKSFDLKKPATYVRPLTDTPTGAQTMFKIADMLKDTVGTAAALRTAFKLAFGNED